MAGISPHAPAASSADALTDAEIARLFQELRHYLNLPVADIAAALRTEPHVVLFLEAGRIDLLPPWAETTRVVRGYAALAGIDADAVLQRLAVQPSRMARAQSATDVVTEAVPAPAAERIVQRLMSRGASGEAGLAGLSLPSFGRSWGQVKQSVGGLSARVRSARHPVRWVLGVAVALVIVASTTAPGMLQASVGGLSSPISGLVRALSDQLTLASAPVREGHRWIEVDDPRQRRGDKLPMPRS